MKILIAESSMLIAERLTRTLNDLPGIQNITHASDAAAVLCSIEGQRPDVTIVDPHIAGREGVELLKNIKRRRPTVIVIVLSNCVSRVHGRKCLEAGADYFLDKSNEFDRVPELIQSIRGLS
jgi:DNA-binding NarL/FixJ family response regulator